MGLSMMQNTGAACASCHVLTSGIQTKDSIPLKERKRKILSVGSYFFVGYIIFKRATSKLL